MLIFRRSSAYISLLDGLESIRCWFMSRFQRLLYRFGARKPFWQSVGFDQARKFAIQTLHDSRVGKSKMGLDHPGVEYWKFRSRSVGKIVIILPNYTIVIIIDHNYYVLYVNNIFSAMVVWWFKIQFMQISQRETDFNQKPRIEIYISDVSERETVSWQFTRRRLLALFKVHQR